MYTKLLYFLIILSISPVLSNAQIRLGVLAGVNSTSFSGDSPDNGDFSSKRGFNAGLTGDYYILDDVVLNLQALYSNKKTGIEYDVPYQYEPLDSMDVTIDFLEIPLNVKVIANNRIAYVTAGLTFSIPMTAKLTDNTLQLETDIEEAFESFAVSANFGVGIQISIGKPLLFFELKYSQGLTNLSKSNYDELSVIEKLKMNGVQLNAGILFTL